MSGKVHEIGYKKDIGRCKFGSRYWWRAIGWNRVLCCRIATLQSSSLANKKRCNLAGFQYFKVAE